MKAAQISKFSFRVRTRDGAVVDNLIIGGHDEKDARRKLLQMYQGCEILNARSQPSPVRCSPASYEEVMNLITAVRS